MRDFYYKNLSLLLLRSLLLGFLVVLSSCGNPNSTTTKQAVEKVAATVEIPAVKSSAAPGKLTLTWSSVASFTSYTVKQGKSSGVYDTEYKNVQSPYTISNLEDGTKYYFLVTSTNTSGQTANAAEISVTTPNITEGALTAIPADKSINLTWKQDDNAIYALSRSTTDADYSVIAKSGISPYLDSNLTNGTTYYYLLVITTGTKISYAKANATPHGKTKPGAFDIVSVVQGNSGVTVTWGASTGVISYIISRSTQATGTFTQIAIAGSSPYIDTKATNGTIYYYKVTAVNVYGSTDSTNIVSSSSQGLPGAFAITNASSGNNSVTVTWGASGNAASYTIARSTTSNGTFTTLSTTAQSPYTDSTAQNGTTYYYRVTAINPNGSTVATGTASSTPFGAPGAFIISNAAAGDSSVTISWENSSNAVTYTISRSTQLNGTYTNLSTTAESPYIDSTAVNDTTYYYKITAVNTRGSTDSTNTLSALPFGAPAAFSILSAVAGNNNVTLTWEESTNATGYIIKRSLTNGNFTQIDTTNQSPYIDTSVVNGNNYYYQITATNSHGNTDATSYVYSSPFGLPGNFSISSAAPANNTVTISWATSGNADSYTIARSTSSNGTYTTLSNAATSPYHDNTAVNGTTYYYKVTAVNVNGNTDASNILSATPFGLPGAFAILSASPGNGSVSVSWQSSANAASYTIARSTSSNGTYTNLSTNATSPYTDNTAQNGTTYYYKVTAVNINGTTDATSVVSSSPFGLPGAFSIISAVAGNNDVLISWGSSANAATYTIARGTNSNGPFTNLSTNASSPYNDNTVSNNTTYYYKLTAVNVNGSTDASSVVSSTPFGVPGAFVISGVVAGNNITTISWGSSANAVSYTIARGTNSNGPFTDLSTNATSPYTDNTVTNSTTYYYQVTAVNTNGSTNANAVVSVTPFGLPGSFAISTATPGNNSATISWGTSANVDTYTIARGTNSNGPFTNLSTNAISPYNDTTLTNDTTYYYKITAVNVNGSTISDNVISVTPFGLPGAFNIVSTTSGDGQVIITWGTSTHADSYTISRSTTSNGTYTQLSTTAQSPYTDTTVTNGTTYYYKITAVNTNGNTVTSAVSETPYGAPGAFYFSSVTPSNTQLTVAWDNAPFATSYSLARGTNSGGPYTTIANPAQSPYVDTAVTNGVTYYYMVTAINARGSTLATAEIFGVPGFSILSVSAGDTQLTLNWGVSTADVSYTLDRGTSAGNYDTTFTNVTSPYVDTGLTNGTEYFYQLTAVGAGNSTNGTSLVSAIPSSDLNCRTWITNHINWTIQAPAMGLNTCYQTKEPAPLVGPLATYPGGLPYLPSSQIPPSVLNSTSVAPLIYKFFCKGQTFVLTNDPSPGAGYYNALYGFIPSSNATALPAGCTLPTPPAGFPSFN